MAEWNGGIWLACWKDLPQFYHLYIHIIIIFFKEYIPHVELIAIFFFKTDNTDNLKKIKKNLIPSPHGGASVIA